MRNTESSRRTRETLKFLVFNTALSVIVSIVISNLFSALSAPLFKPLEKRLMLAALSLLLALTLLSIILWTSFARNSAKQAEEWLQTFGRPAALHFEKIASGSGKYYKALLEALGSVSEGDKILIQTWHGTLTPNRFQNEPDERKQARKKYLDLLLDKAKQKGIEYRRILCFDNPPTDGIVPAGHVSSWLAEHCQAMLTLRSQDGDRISIKTARAKIRADIVVIPGRIGCVVFDLFNSNWEKAESALLIFHDPPNLEIVSKLGSWFMEIDGDEDTRVVKQFKLSVDSSVGRVPIPTEQIDS